MKGTVKFFNEAKGFGFIIGEDGKEVFVHKSSLSEGLILHENDAVSYDVESGDRGDKAVNVKKLEKTEEAETEKEAESSEESQEAEQPAEEEAKEE